MDFPPKAFQIWIGRGGPIFWVTPSKFSKSIQLLKIFEWYYYDFLRSLIVSDLGKSVWSVPSISIGVLGLIQHTVKKSKATKITKHPPRFLIYGAKMSDKWIKSKKKFLYIVLFCKVKLSKMASIKTNKIEKPTALF